MKKLISAHIEENLRGYIVVMLIFAAGIIAGAFTACRYGGETADYITEFFDSVIRIIKTSPADTKLIFESTLSDTLISFGLIWISGFTVIGALWSLFSVMKSGFITGFTLCFLINIYSYSALPVAAVSILFRCVFYFPFIFFLSVEVLKLSGMLLKMISGKIKYRTSLKYQILRYFLIMVSAFGIAVIYSLFEAYAGCSLLSRLVI